MSAKLVRATRTTASIPDSIRFDSIQKVVQNDENLSALHRRKLVKQTFRMIFDQRQELIRVALEVEKRKLKDLQLIAERRITVETESISLQIREEYIRTMRSLGLRVELAQLEFLTDFADALKSFRQRLLKRHLDPSEKKYILKISKDAFFRVAEKLGDLTNRMIDETNKRIEE